MESLEGQRPRRRRVRMPRYERRSAKHLYLRPAGPQALHGGVKVLSREMVGWNCWRAGGLAGRGYEFDGFISAIGNIPTCGRRGRRPYMGALKYRVAKWWVELLEGRRPSTGTTREAGLVIYFRERIKRMVRPERIELPIYFVPLLLFPRPWLGATSAQGCASSPCIWITREFDPPRCYHDFPDGKSWCARRGSNSRPQV
jgi:hypothetical protein